MTQGQLLFYGGIGGIAVFTIMFVLCWIIFDKKKNKLIKKIDSEIDS